MKHDPAWTLPVPIAGKKYFNLGINRAYEAARLGEIPTVRIGRRVLACVPAIEKMISQAGSQPAAPTSNQAAKTKSRAGGGRPRVRLTAADCAAVPPDQHVELGDALVALTSSERLLARKRGGDLEFARRKTKTKAKYASNTADANDAEGNNSP